MADGQKQSSSLDWNAILNGVLFGFVGGAVGKYVGRAGDAKGGMAEKVLTWVVGISGAIMGYYTTHKSQQPEEQKPIPQLEAPTITMTPASVTRVSAVEHAGTVTPAAQQRVL